MDVIRFIEQNVDVNSFKVDNVHLWPYYRRELWMQLQVALTRDKVLYTPPRSISPLDSKHHFFVPIAYLASLILRVVCAISSQRFRRKIKLTFRSSKKRISLFLSKKNYYQTEVVGGWLESHVDPILLTHNSTIENGVKIEFSKKGQNKPSFIKPERIDPYYWSVLFSVKFLYLKDGEITKKFNEFAHEFLGLDKAVFEVLNFHLGLGSNFNYLKKYNFLKFLYENVFDGLEAYIGTVYTEYYYSQESMVLFDFCHNKIQTIDVQHGKQGFPHGMYSNWDVIPRSGYSSLPTIFWSWGEESANNISRFLPSQCKHLVKVGGYPRIPHLQMGSFQPKVDPSSKVFLDSLARYDKVILITLQHDGEIPDFVLETILKAPKSAFWLIRLHPAVSRNSSADVKGRLKNSGASNFDIHFSNRIDLYTLLLSTDIHLTKWSSVCFEASFFNVPTILIDERGLQFYSSNIERGEFYYASSKEELSALVENGVGFVSMNKPYIVTDLSTTENTIKFVNELTC